MQENRDFEREFIPPPLPMEDSSDSTGNGGEFIPPPLPHSEPKPAAPPKKQEPTCEGGGDKKRPVVAVVAVIAIVAGCLVIWKTGIFSGQGQINEADYKQAIQKHFDDVHQQSVQSYTFDEFEVGENGATAKLQVEAYLQPPEYAADMDISDYGIAHLTSTIQLDETCSITSCSLCNLLGVQDVEDAENAESTSAPEEYGDESTQPETVSATAGNLVVNIAEYAPMGEEATYTYSEWGEWNCDMDILVTSDIQNFKIVQLVLGEDSALHVDGVLDEVAFLSAGDVLRVGLSMGDITNRGVAYMDGEGKQHVYGIGLNGYDGSIHTTSVSLPDIGYRYWIEGTYGELSARYGDVSKTFYQDQLNYFVFEEEPNVAFAFGTSNQDVEGLVPGDGDRCIAVLASAETLFGLEYSVSSVELQVALGVENVEDLYTYDGRTYVTWAVGNSWVVLFVEVSESGKIEPENVVSMVN